MSSKKIRIPSEAKSEVAVRKVRGPDGKFIPADPIQQAKKLDALKEVEVLNAKLSDETRIPDEDKDYIGNDSRKFFEKALERAPTWYEGYKYAKELKAIQHPSLQAIQANIKAEITTKVLKWEWDEEPLTITVESKDLLGSSLEPLEDTLLGISTKE